MVFPPGAILVLRRAPPPPLRLNKNPSTPNQNEPPPPDIIDTFRIGVDDGVGDGERIKDNAPVDEFIVTDGADAAILAAAAYNPLNVVVNVNVLKL